MRIAVIGGGLFGCTAAVHAARAGNEVHLFEAREALMQAASGCSYYRLHRGAHYPRSAETGREGRAAEASFRSEYGACLVDGGRQFYVVPTDARSHVSASEFTEFLDNEELPFYEVDDDTFNGAAFSVKEPRINLQAMQALVRDKVDRAGIHVILNARAYRSMRLDFDKIIVAAYARTNDVLGELGCEPQEYKFQVVEKPVVLLPERFRDMSVVVVDGPFGCIDPCDDTPLHVLGHVVHTVHACNVGTAPEVPDHLVRLVHRGIIRAPEHTKIREVVTGLEQFVRGVRWSMHIGSVYVIRAVLAHQEATDARPTLVSAVDDQVVRIFSGKLGTAVRAARDAVSMILGRAEAKAA